MKKTEQNRIPFSSPVREHMDFVLGLRKERVTYEEICRRLENEKGVKIKKSGLQRVVQSFLNNPDPYGEKRINQILGEKVYSPAPFSKSLPLEGTVETNPAKSSLADDFNFDDPIASESEDWQTQLIMARRPATAPEQIFFNSKATSEEKEKLKTISISIPKDQINWLCNYMEAAPRLYEDK